jgi:hypothetical protein
VYDIGKARGDSSIQIKKDMEIKITSLNPRLVSRHTLGDPSSTNVVDIAPSSIRPSNKTQVLEEVLKENTGSGPDFLLDQFLGPRTDLGNDPAYHLSIPQASDGDIEPVDDALPDIGFSLRNNTNFKSDSAWMAPLAKDRILKEDFEQVS